MQDCPLPSLPQLTGPSQTLPLACPSPGNEKFPLYLPMVRCPHPIQNLFPGTIIHHYMDDTLVCASEKSYLDRTGNRMIKVSENAVFEIWEDKIQCTCPWAYLGPQIQEKTIVPQQLTIWDNPKTPRDLHQLCGSISWVRPLLGITTEDFIPLFNLLCGSENLHSP